jgi:hypothetical protein
MNRRLFDGFSQDFVRKNRVFTAGRGVGCFEITNLRVGHAGARRIFINALYSGRAVGVWPKSFVLAEARKKAAQVLAGP